MPDKILQQQLFFKEEIELGMEQAREQILRYVPEGRERSLALTKLEEAAMWANKGIFKG